MTSPGVWEVSREPKSRTPLENIPEPRTGQAVYCDPEDRCCRRPAPACVCVKKPRVKANRVTLAYLSQGFSRPAVFSEGLVSSVADMQLCQTLARMEIRADALAKLCPLRI